MAQLTTSISKHFNNFYFVKDLVVAKVEVLKKDPNTNRTKLEEQLKIFIANDQSIEPIQNIYYYQTDKNIYRLSNFLTFEYKKQIISRKKLDRLEYEINRYELKSFDKKPQLTKPQNEARNVAQKRLSFYDGLVNNLSKQIINLTIPEQNEKEKTINTPQPEETFQSDEAALLELRQNMRALSNQTRSSAGIKSPGNVYTKNMY